MAENVRLQTIKAMRIRIADLQASGEPQPGAGHAYVSDSLVDATLKLVFEAGADQTQKNGSDNICATYATQDKIKRVEVALNFCQLDLYLISKLTGSTRFDVAGGALPIGLQMQSFNAPDPNGVCMELWSEAWAGAQQATPSQTSPNAAYWHWVFPKVLGVPGDIKLDTNIGVIPVNTKCSENTNVTANGPFDDWPAAIVAAGGVTTSYGFFLDSSIPAATGALSAVTSAAS